MKRFVILLLTLCIALCAAACGDADISPADGTTTTKSETTTTSTESGGETTTVGDATTSTESGGETTTVGDATTTTALPTSIGTTTTTASGKPTEPAHRHSYSGAVTKAATCTEKGVKTFTCLCGASYTEQLAATGHAWGEWQTVQEPTAATAGARERKCNHCGATERKALPPVTENTGIVTDTQLQKIKEGFLMLVNQERSRVGAAPLTLDVFLDDAALIRSDEIVDSFSHIRPNGQAFHTAIDTESYPYSSLGENICMTTHVGTGSYTPDDAWTGTDTQIEAAYSWIFKCFQDSPPHYESMINPNFEHCGIGITYVEHEQAPLPLFYVAHIFGAQ